MTDCYFSICVISALRVVYIANMDLNDFTYAAADLVLWSFLEPSLGIINASLPVLKPVGSLIVHSPALDWARSSSRTSRSMAATAPGRKPTSGWTKSASRKSQSESFQRLEDPTDRMYPLDTINLVGEEDRRPSGISTLDYPQKAALGP
jgi:hypothetical protein